MPGSARVVDVSRAPSAWWIRVPWVNIELPRAAVMMPGGYAVAEAVATGDDNNDDDGDGDCGVSPDSPPRVPVRSIYFQYLVTHLHELARQSREDFDEQKPINGFTFAEGLGRVEIEDDAITRTYNGGDFPQTTVLPIRAITITAYTFATDDDSDDDVLSWQRMMKTPINFITLRVTATAAAESPFSNASAPLFDVRFATNTKAGS
ncbi:hypothetical protein CYMTET_2682 [Cymbomonas tetramitiformis]|uniref:Uncharacterized protein n=1 Tax=Cymbomonas tetramitiformis TaxID=36881 RepID=A0AAE0BWR7_9CHLO|nr:hypothetical protein CYMTET_47133 [Cymbomonas tetramitiformis]KAK3243759.1 hypothetical protein CYMTET_46594 [Cymbomonas tetramitiformis]KAK3252023.1 hypothetical protein CYMTET_38664 [Cymbomonas tetramitiformis]KAK3288122.1 hypothetical protein CYMTET_4387 [Cymbomonas tetramitiformis]KAK3289887.1 hypothetical protein CYMTET_2682 [Cymbomonas tetramitiformis]|eukprot:gene32742-41670_t